MNFETLDFPTAWEIQNEVGPKLEHHPFCSSVPGWNKLSGPALLCDCGAIRKEWERMKSSPPADIANNLGLAQQCWHMAQAACDALGMKFDETSPSEIRGAIGNLKQDIREWIQIAKYQRQWFQDNHTAGKDAGPCPTDAGIRKSEQLIGAK